MGPDQYVGRFTGHFYSRLSNHQIFSDEFLHLLTSQFYHQITWLTSKLSTRTMMDISRPKRCNNEWKSFERTSHWKVLSLLLNRKTKTVTTSLITEVRRKLVKNSTLTFCHELSACNYRLKNCRIRPQNSPLVLRTYARWLRMMNSLGRGRK